MKPTARIREVDPILRTRKGLGLGVACSGCRSFDPLTRAVVAVGVGVRLPASKELVGARPFARPQLRQLPQPRNPRSSSLVLL
jgi:hypothetical protein